MKPTIDLICLIAIFSSLTILNITTVGGVG